MRNWPRDNPRTTVCLPSHIFEYVRLIHAERNIHAKTRIRDSFLNKIFPKSLSGNGDYSIFANTVIKNILLAILCTAHISRSANSVASPDHRPAWRLPSVCCETQENDHDQQD
jgi:hypothetical protein